MATRVRDIVGNKRRQVPTLLMVTVGEPLKRALSLIERHDITQVPVFRDGEPVGTLYDSDLLKTVLADAGAVERPVEDWMQEPLPEINADEPVERLTRLLGARSPAVLVRDNGAVIGILTRFDMLQFIAGGE